MNGRVDDGRENDEKYQYITIRHPSWRPCPSRSKFSALCQSRPGASGLVSCAIRQGISRAATEYIVSKELKLGLGGLEHTIKLRLLLAEATVRFRPTASITFPLTFNAPVMNAFCPFSFPSARLMNVSSERLMVTSGFLAAPLVTVPSFLRSILACF